MTDIISTIDEVTAAMCGWCQKPLGGDGPSLLYCGPDCQWEYDQLQGERLVGYREPTDLPMHVANLHEEYSPEVTPAFASGRRFVSRETELWDSNIAPMYEWMSDRLNATLGDFRGWSFIFDWADEPPFPASTPWLMRQQYGGFWDSIRTHIPHVAVDPCASGSPWVVVEQPQSERMPDLPAVNAEDLFAYTEDGSPSVALPQMPELPPLPVGFGYESITEQVRRGERRRW